MLGTECESIFDRIRTFLSDAMCLLCACAQYYPYYLFTKVAFGHVLGIAFWRRTPREVYPSRMLLDFEEPPLDFSVEAWFRDKAIISSHSDSWLLNLTGLRNQSEGTIQRCVRWSREWKPCCLLRGSALGVYLYSRETATCLSISRLKCDIATKQ